VPLLSSPTIAVADSGIFMIPPLAERVLEEEKAEAEAINVLA